MNPVITVNPVYLMFKHDRSSNVIGSNSHTFRFDVDNWCVLYCGWHLCSDEYLVIGLGRFVGYRPILRETQE